MNRHLISIACSAVFAGCGGHSDTLTSGDSGPGDSGFLFDALTADSNSAGDSNVAAAMEETSVVVAYTYAQFDPQGSGQVSLSTEDELRLEEGSRAKITFASDFAEEGDFVVEVQLLSGNGWSVALNPQTTLSSLSIGVADVNNAGHIAHRLLDVVVSAPPNPDAGVTSAGEFEFRIRRPARNTARVFRMRLTPCSYPCG